VFSVTQKYVWEWNGRSHGLHAETILALALITHNFTQGRQGQETCKAFMLLTGRHNCRLAN